MKSYTLCHQAGLFLCSLLFTIPGMTQVVSVAAGSWNSGSTWSTGAIPAPGADVIIRHNVTIPNSAFSATVNSLTIENSAGENAQLSFNSGTATRSLQITSNLVVTATTNNNCRFYLQGANTSVQVGGDIVLTRNHSGFVDAFGLHLRSGSSVTASNLTLYYINSADDHQEVYVREHSSLILTGDIFVESTGGVEEPSIDVIDDAWLECNNFTMLLSLPEAASGVGRDAELRIWENGRALVRGDFLARRTGGRRINITIGNGSSSQANLTVEGNMTLEHLNGLNHTNKDLPLEITGSSSVYVKGNLSAYSNSSRALNIELYNNSKLDVDGLVTMTGSTNTNCVINAYNTSQIFFGGDIIMNYPSTPNASAFSFAATSPNFTTVIFDGTANQTVPAETYGNLVINNTSHVTLQGNITVNNHLNMILGKVIAANRMVTLPVAATINGSWLSYICNGTLKRTIAAGATNYWFYVGDTARGYSPVTLSNISATSTFEVTYYPVSGAQAPAPGPYSPLVKSPSLARVSNREYWMINRTGGTGAAQVGLGWNSASAVNSSILHELRIAHWTGGQWTDTGPTVYSGDGNSGMVRTTTDIPSFSPFTLASTDVNNFFILPAPLFGPLHAARQQDNVQLQWKSQLAASNTMVTIERSDDGIHFESIGSMQLHAISVNQLFTWYDDNAVACKSWYRFKWQSSDGAASYSNTAMVNVSIADEPIIYPNPVRSGSNSTITIQLPQCGKEGWIIRITDLSGRQLYIARTQEGAGNHTIPVMPNLKRKGMYLVQLQGAGNRYTTKILVE